MHNEGLMSNHLILGSNVLFEKIPTLSVILCNVMDVLPQILDIYHSFTIVKDKKKSSINDFNNYHDKIRACVV